MSTVDAKHRAAVSGNSLTTPRFGLADSRRILDDGQCGPGVAERIEHPRQHIPAWQGPWMRWPFLVEKAGRVVAPSLIPDSKLSYKGNCSFFFQLTYFIYVAEAADLRRSGGGGFPACPRREPLYGGIHVLLKPLLTVAHAATTWPRLPNQRGRSGHRLLM
jgi:hypothetical protein